MLSAKCTTLLTLVIYGLQSCNCQLLEGIYCGKENCYEVLNVARDAPKSEIAKNYRQLAKKYHPDLHRGEEAKKIAEEKFKSIATAYEILKDDEARTDYDYMLDNPNEYYAHYYRYYRRRVAPKVDVRIVVFVAITIISIIQYYSAWQRYDTAITYFMTVPKYRNHALQIAREEKMLCDKDMRAGRGRDKGEVKKFQEDVIRKVIEDKMDIQGAYAKPSICDVLWIQLVTFPYSVAKYLGWLGRWFIKFMILKHPYGEEEKLYLIRRNLRMKQFTFDGLDGNIKQDYMNRELWIPEKFQKWRQDREAEEKKVLAESAKHKMYRRYLKNHGVGRITFDDS